jgi:hypothetical protein
MNPNQVKSLMSKEARDELMLNVLENERLDELLDYFTSDDSRLREKSSWVLQQITDDYPEALLPHKHRFISHLPHCTTDAEKRFIMRYFNFQPLPTNEEELTQLMNFGFDWLMDPKEAIAQRAFAMTTLYRISEVVPEIKHELAVTIEAQREFSSSGFKNRAKHILKMLNAE